MRPFILLALLCAYSLCAAQDAASPPPRILESARLALQIPGDSATLVGSDLTGADTSALGCHWLRGLPLAYAIEVYRLELALAERSLPVHVSADGSLTQICDPSLAGLGAGLLPVAPDPARDSDGDGIGDGDDDCPGIAGVAGRLQVGCPQPEAGDRDGDGRLDSDDICPDQAGSAQSGGCALLQDSDGDGVPEGDDICPAQAGLIRSDFALGCPADGSGLSERRRAEHERCFVAGAGIPLYEQPSRSSAVIDRVYLTDRAELLARDAGGRWYQLRRGWVAAEEADLQGACYNIPIAQATPGAATGCFLRPLAEAVNVRQAPGGKRVAQITPDQIVAALGQNAAGDWLFFRAGWVSRSVVGFSGLCDDLPRLDPQKAASGTIAFCPPDYRGFLPPRIAVGDSSAQVASYTLANRLRAAPSLNAEQIGEIPPRALLEAVLDGPACDGAFVWWQVQAGEQIGWTVESDRNANVYYLERASAPDPAAEAGSLNAESAPISAGRLASLPMISSANAAQLDIIRALRVLDPLRVAWSPGPAELAVLRGDGMIEIYSAATFDRLWKSAMQPDSPRVTALAYSPDGSLLALGSDAGAVTLTDADALDVVPGDPLAQRHKGPVRQLAWSPDGRRLASISSAGDERAFSQKNSLLLWRIDDANSAPMAEPQLHFSFPHALTALAFSADGRWLAISGDSPGLGRASLWIYAAASGELAFAKPLISMAGQGLLAATPDDALGDFVYSSGDSLYHIDIDAGRDRRFYHLAGAHLPQLAIRRQVIPAAEVLLALASQDPTGPAQLHFFNARNHESPQVSRPIAVNDMAFSPDGSLLAIAEGGRDRVLLLGAGG